ncbi:LD-carboxypeptidase family protein [Clostridium bornimense]|uniref:LD-carboxypeptidase family protein n=1 Tax=Clostridium bornimense TaxID=1216932 RepID=W6RY30_9CLOT|nr:S66 peptidase family protein [Clostridium bornimense]CDM69368.1 LD-carboxypeptidase family protein [Clostridium bornimense]
MLNIKDKVAIVGCSNAQLKTARPKIDTLVEVLESIGLQPICSDYIYEKYSVFSGSGKERADALMKFYLDDSIKAIFDISGGNVANEVLEYLDFEIIKKNPKLFFGYSDLTTVINAIYSKTEISSFLYQIRNLIYDHGEEQIENFRKTILEDKNDLLNINYRFLQGNSISGTVVGGNIRCFLKLAGTPYMPSFKDKVLFLESLGGEVPLMTTYLNQLKQMGAFNEVKGIILGTFTEMEEKQAKPTIEQLVLDIVNNKEIPIAKTEDIGHGSNSKAIVIGGEIKL